MLEMAIIESGISSSYRKAYGLPFAKTTFFSESFSQNLEIWPPKVGRSDTCGDFTFTRIGSEKGQKVRRKRIFGSRKWNFLFPTFYGDSKFLSSFLKIELFFFPFPHNFFPLVPTTKSLSRFFRKSAQKMLPKTDFLRIPILDPQTNSQQLRDNRVVLFAKVKLNGPTKRFFSHFSACPPPYPGM